MTTGPDLTATDKLALEEGCRFDADAADSAVRFIESKVVLSVGVWAGQPIRLLPWQLDFVRRIFGWKRDDGSRRYRTAHLSAGKKNGLTTLLLATAAALARESSKPRPCVRLQASFPGYADFLEQAVRRMYRESPELARTVSLVPSRRQVLDRISGGELRIWSTRAESLNGLHDSAAIIDELHRLSDDRLWESTRPGSCVRPDGLGVTATVAGLDPGKWLVERRYAWKVNSGEVRDVGHLAMVFEPDPGDDPGSPETWRKANPSLGTIIAEDYLRAAHERATRTLGELTQFKRFNLNQVV